MDSPHKGPIMQKEILCHDILCLLKRENSVQRVSKRSVYKELIINVIRLTAVPYKRILQIMCVSES